MKLEPNVEALLLQRYYKPNEDWPKLVNRVVDYVCADEADEYIEQVRHDILNRVWLPNSPCLVNAGTKNSGLTACFVVDPDQDTLENHVEALGDIAAVGKRGGGCGFTGTFIRPEGSPVAGSAHGYAYGANNWAVRVSDYLDMITQGGFRKMALMYTMRSDHPDLDKFINLKQGKDERFAYNFNQSVMATDEWMNEAIEDKDSIAGKQLHKLAQNAWNNGEPGLLFHTTINNSTPYKTTNVAIESTNPCGEQPLPNKGACVLGSINVSHDLFFDEHGDFDFYALDKVAKTITRFLDNVGSKNVFPNDKFKQWYEEFRPIGVGIMGLADALLRLKIKYGSEDSIAFLDQVMKHVYRSARDESVRLGVERGIPSRCGIVGRRNITLVTIAPTGSIGFIANCSHSIEPIFSPVYNRTDERGETYLFEHPSREMDYFVSAINDDNNKVPTWKQHIDIQSAAQKWSDSGVSKTINMPYEATVDDVHDAMIYAWQSGCKGVTVYRDGSRQFQVLNEVKEEDQSVIDCPSGTCEI